MPVAHLCLQFHLPPCAFHQIPVTGRFTDMWRNLKKRLLGLFYSILCVIFRVSAGFMCLLGSMFGLWSVLEFFVTACVGVSWETGHWSEGSLVRKLYSRRVRVRVMFRTSAPSDQ